MWGAPHVLLAVGVQMRKGGPKQAEHGRDKVPLQYVQEYINV